MFLLGVSIFSEENLSMSINKSGGLSLEGNESKYKDDKKVVSETDDFFSKEGEKNKFFRLKLVGGLDGEIRDNLDKEYISDAGISYEGLIESVYRISKTYEVAMGTGIQKLGTMKFKDRGLSKDYENVYSIPLYIAVKRNFFKGPVYLKQMLVCLSIFQQMMLKKLEMVRRLKAVFITEQV